MHIRANVASQCLRQMTLTQVVQLAEHEIRYHLHIWQGGRGGGVGRGDVVRGARCTLCQQLLKAYQCLDLCDQDELPPDFGA